MFGSKDRRPSHEEIQARAYEIYLQRGGGDDRALEDWFVAEEQLLRERSETNIAGTRLSVATAGRHNFA